MTSQKSVLEFKNITEKSRIKIVFQLADIGATKAEGVVIFKGSFTTNSATTDGKRKWSLRTLLAEHAPEQFEKLKFGVGPNGEKLEAEAFALNAPSVLELDIPTKAFPLMGKGNVTLTTECRLDSKTPGLATVHVLDHVPTNGETGRPLIDAKHPAATPFQTSAEAFCRLFPNRFFYVDATRGLSAGFHLIEGFFRDDQPLCRSVLSDTENAELDRLWREMYFVTGIWEKMLRGFVFFERSERNFLKDPEFDSFKEEDPDLVKDETLVRFKAVYLRLSKVKVTGDELAKHPISVFFEDVRNGLRRQSEILQRAEPIYRKDLRAFAERAYRRPLTANERQRMENFFNAVSHDKDQGIEVAVRSSIIRVLLSPHFCMRFEPAPAGDSVAPLPDLALATRLSYFIWSGPPDAELNTLATTGKLHEPRVLSEQVRRMLQDPKVSRFALEFFGQWLGYRDFLTQEAVSRQAFPMFDDALKQAMFEEPTRLITHLIQHDRPITEVLNGDTTLVNKRLARITACHSSAKATNGS